MYKMKGELNFMKKLSNVILLLSSLLGYGLLLMCLGYYCLNSPEVLPSISDMLFTFVFFGLLCGIVHLINITASIIAFFAKFRGISMICMGTTIAAFMTTGIWNPFMRADDGTTMLDNPLFLVVWLLHAACSVAFCIVKFAKRW